MANITINVEHKLTQSEAILRLQKSLSEAKEKYGDRVTNLKEQWRGNTLTLSGDTRGKKVGVKIVVGAPTIVIEGDVPRVFLLFKGKIQKAIQNEAEKIFKL